MANLRIIKGGKEGEPITPKPVKRPTIADIDKAIQADLDVTARLAGMVTGAIAIPDKQAPLPFVDDDKRPTTIKDREGVTEMLTIDAYLRAVTARAVKRVTKGK